VGALWFGVRFVFLGLDRGMRMVPWSCFESDFKDLNSKAKSKATAYDIPLRGLPVTFFFQKRK
jgi:hypothetical protein